jgi:hypothetical protein
MWYPNTSQPRRVKITNILEKLAAFTFRVHHFNPEEGGSKFLWNISNLCHFDHGMIPRRLCDKNYHLPLLPFLTLSTGSNQFEASGEDTVLLMIDMSDEKLSHICY